MTRLRLPKVATPALIAFIVTACDASPPPVGMARGEELFETCAPCHGPEATGNPDIQAPSIAGLPQWYIEAQLHSFQQGWRGKHAEDLSGLRMRPMAMSLNREGDIESVAEYVSSLPTDYPESTLRGNAGAGASLYTPCVSCHGMNGLGNDTLRAPPIVQLDDWYLAEELRNFRVGARGANPSDTWGLTMRSQAALLSDQAIEDVIAYVQTLR